MTTTTLAPLPVPAAGGPGRASTALLLLLLALLGLAPPSLASGSPEGAAGRAADGAAGGVAAPSSGAAAEGPGESGSGPAGPPGREAPDGEDERPATVEDPAPEPVVAHAGGRSRSRSLVIVLHGGSWTGATPEELARRAVADLHDEARRARLRLLAPEGPEVEGGRVPWLTDEGQRRVLALVEREVAAGRCAADRVTLAGHGAGATGALHLAASHPQRFAAVAVWSGTPPPLWDAERTVIGLAPDPVPGLAGVPVYLWTGGDDPILDRAALELFVTGMAAAGSRHELTWERGPGGHDLGPKGPRAGLRFLARHRKRERP